MAERKTTGISRRSSANAGVQHIIPPDPFTPPERTVSGNSSAVRRFMTENPAGSLPDEPEQISGGGAVWLEDGPLPEGETPESIAQKQQAAAAAASEEQPTVETPAAQPETPQGAVTPAPAAKPTEPAVAAPAAATPTPTAEPAKPSYAPDEKIHLVEGVEPWTREGIVTRLQEGEQMRPLVQEAQRFYKTFGMNAEKAEAEWRPILEIMQRDPSRTAFLETALHADSGLLDYLRKSVEFYNSPEAREARGESAQPASATTRPAASTESTLPPKYEKMFESMRAREIRNRASNEWSTAYERYPFLRTNERVRRALNEAALNLYNADVASGKDELEARGLIEAMEGLKVFLEAQAAVATAQARTTPSEPVPSPVLPATGPALTPTRTATPSTEYRGKDPVGEFIKQYPGRQ